jgi:hypothetical protein
LPLLNLAKKKETQTSKLAMQVCVTLLILRVLKVLTMIKGIRELSEWILLYPAG